MAPKKQNSQIFWTLLCSALILLLFPRNPFRSSPRRLSINTIQVPQIAQKEPLSLKFQFWTISHGYCGKSLQSQEITRHIFQFTFFKCNRQSRRSPFVVPLSDFRYPQEVRGYSCNLESEEDKFVNFSSTCSDGDPQSNPSGTSQLRLSGLQRPQRRLPSRAYSPSVKAFSGVQVSGQDLRLQGPPFQPKGLSMGLFKSRGLCHRLLTSLRHKDLLLPICICICWVLQTNSADGIYCCRRVYG